MLNGKQVVELMKKAGWTPAALAESINSRIRIERHTKHTDADEVTVEQAESVLKRGSGLSGAQEDVFERWVASRLGHDGVGTNTFQKPMPSETLKLNLPPVPVGIEIEPASDTIAFKDQTNHRARQKLIAA